MQFVVLRTVLDENISKCRSEFMGIFQTWDEAACVGWEHLGFKQAPTTEEELNESVFVAHGQLAEFGKHQRGDFGKLSGWKVEW